MSEYALPCFVCATSLHNAFADVDNQPYGGTEFRTSGHYGSTFWDSFDGEELVLNICDDCLQAATARLGQHKRFLPVIAAGVGTVGTVPVDRPLVGFTGHLDDTAVRVELGEIGSALPGVIWFQNADELRRHALRIQDASPH